ncbi:hypothetical protein Ddye_019556 [Dipteronia dyeriana]|uniref:Uncharacterized protein n=1 Tax=Dipteronia dyeriana TaxID=168575 RepID=A0AAD9TYE9_9ROSI|nr:hypothetical protein Ddye_019556 [Dipteronia dyeriana]
MRGGDGHLQPWRDLNGKVVMVTGTSSSIGRQLCFDLTKFSGRIVIPAQRVNRLKFLCNDINSSATSPPPLGAVVV